MHFLGKVAGLLAARWPDLKIAIIVGFIVTEFVNCLDGFIATVIP